MNGGRAAQAPWVCVTGATGFVGREVARRLLRRERRVLVLGRARSGVALRDRVAASLGIEPDGRLLDVAEHDFTAATLDAELVARLRADVETVIHCAGDTTFVSGDPDRFRAGHVDGPVALMHALAGPRLRRWVQVSTAFVCGRRTGCVREDEGDEGQDFHNPYERVKLDAEIAVRRAGARAHVGVTVLRPSIVVGAAPPTGGGMPSELVFELIRLLAALARAAPDGRASFRIAGRPQAPFNIVPVEHVADAAIALAGHADAAGRTCHVVVPAAPGQAAMLALVTRHLGIDGPRIVGGPLADPSPLEAHVDALVARYRDYVVQDVVFDDATARALLDACGVPPPVLDAAAVAQLVDLALTSPSRVLEVRARGPRW
jgi:nucleoside-diphosphate-sugar epimerase